MILQVFCALFSRAFNSPKCGIQYIDTYKRFIYLWDLKWKRDRQAKSGL